MINYLLENKSKSVHLDISFNLCLYEDRKLTALLRLGEMGND